MQKVDIINYDSLKENDPLLIEAKKQVKELLRMEEINHPEPSREEIYAAQEDAWFHHLTDQFPTPLTEVN